mmetsp:Transcript_124970/g.286354  ORF Transcript_124970/g.286354 Transcript_124970/m.286354 type:complete len:233 (+) Transcript_124970:11-709(+)
MHAFRLLATARRRAPQLIQARWTMSPQMSSILRAQNTLALRGLRAMVDEDGEYNGQSRSWLELISHCDALLTAPALVNSAPPELIKWSQAMASIQENLEGQGFFIHQAKLQIKDISDEAGPQVEVNPLPVVEVAFPEADALAQRTVDQLDAFKTRGWPVAKEEVAALLRPLMLSQSVPKGPKVATHLVERVEELLETYVGAAVEERGGELRPEDVSAMVANLSGWMRQQARK